jgi:lipid-binding SYLF domain-containing protein
MIQKGNFYMFYLASARRMIQLLMMCVLVAHSSLSLANPKDGGYNEALQRFQSAQATAPFFKNAYGYALFPTVGKGGFGIGGAYGEGRVYRKGTHVGDSQLAQVTIGFQLGGQVYSEIIFFKTEKAYQEFTTGNFEFGAQASAVALTVGASAQAGTAGVGASVGDKQSEAHYVDGMAIFTVTKGGLMYEASLGGQGFSFDPNSKF